MTAHRRPVATEEAPKPKVEADPKVVRLATHAALRQAALVAVNKLSYTIEEACEATGLSKSTLYEESAQKHLEMGKLCGRTVIRAEEFRRWFNARYEVLARRG